MKHPGTRVVSEEPNGGIASSIAGANNITLDWVDIVVFAVWTCALDDAEGVLWI